MLGYQEEHADFYWDVQMEVAVFSCKALFLSLRWNKRCLTA